MFNIYKSEVKSSERSTPLHQISDYEESINEIVMANQCLDYSSKKYHDLVYDLPSLSFDRLEGITTMKLYKNIIGMLNIQVRIGDKKMKFLFDTGAQVSCINSKYLSSELGISSTDKDVDVGDSSGTFGKMKIALVDRIDVMGLSVTNLPVLAMNEKQLSLSILGKTVYEIQGILGWDIIKLVDFELDYENLQLKLYPERNEFHYRNLIKSNFPIVFLTDEKGSIRKFGIDTGARKSWINKSLIKKCNLTVLKEKKEKVHGAHGAIEQDIYVIDDYCVHFQNNKIKFTNIKTGYTKLLNDYELDGVLGIDILKKKNMQFFNNSEVLILK